jgi:UDP-N-acetylmuramate--alanine ligase
LAAGFELVPGQSIHIVGISGFGMSAIARVLHERGFLVSGSDQKMSPLSEALADDGVQVRIGHSSSYVTQKDLVLVSSAIPEDNAEVAAACSLNIPVMRRRKAIELITQGYQTIAIAGTHGKTTTTGLLTHVLIEAGFDPTYIIGGILKNSGVNAGVGQSDIFVIEADEYGEMFLGLNPAIAVLTSIEYDHPDAFPTLPAMVRTFEKFISCLEDDGRLVGCLDYSPIKDILHQRSTRGSADSSYSTTHIQADWYASSIQTTSTGTTFSVYHEQTLLGNADLSLSGIHNVQNALAVLAITHQLEIPFEIVAKALQNFKGTGRRSEVMGQVEGVLVVSDYAHHPTAIRLTLNAWRQKPELRQLWAVWQPHTYNRLRALSDDFVLAFDDAEHVIVTDVYSVREEITPGLTAPELVHRIRQTGHPDVRYGGSLEGTADMLAHEVRPGDCVIILSAGDGPEVGLHLLKRLEVG